MEIDPNEGWKVDKAERRIRLGCGATAGFFFGGLIAFRWSMGNLWIAVPVSIVVSVVVAVLATKHGDRFWSWVARTLWWQWPTQ